MKKKGAPSESVPVEAWPKVYDCFGEPPVKTWVLPKEPSSFNGDVKVERFRVTVERVEEPVEVLRERLVKLWRECGNCHHWTPIKAKARKYGLELDMKDCGVDRERKV